MDGLAVDLAEYAAYLGFSSLGIVPASPSPYLYAYLQWVQEGFHGKMDYLARQDRIVRRRDLNQVLPGVRSLIVVTLDYASVAPPEVILSNPVRGRIARYAWGLDYHAIFQEQLTALAIYLEKRAGSAVNTRIYSDTGAVLERSHAQQAGLGFIGKNTMLISPRHGSYFLLGEVFTDLSIEMTLPVRAMPGCGTCSRCLTACPTGAFPKPYVLDARICISYLTIELKGYIPHHLRRLMSNWVFGCDICQDVCPWQRFAVPRSPAFYPPPSVDLAAPLLSDLLLLDEIGFQERYGRTAIRRVKRVGLVRNACIAAGNSGDPQLLDQLLAVAGDPSPLVRAHASWAILQISNNPDLILRILRNETDEAAYSDIEASIEEAARNG